MTSAIEHLQAPLAERTSQILDACTACGACVRACPTPQITGTDVSQPEAVAKGVLDILRGNPGPDTARRWATECCGSGRCLSVCEEGINPRFMLVMARAALSAENPEPERRNAGKAAFKTMSRGVRVLSRLQLSPALMERLSPSSHPARQTSPDMIFYTGCNMLKTPHIGLLCLDVLDRLGLSYEVYGGPANCCGILQLRPGDTANASRQAGRTLERFSETGASAVVSWCPTCQMQFTETLPSAQKAGPTMDIQLLPVFLAAHLEQLKPLMVNPVNKRVALHEYSGAFGVVESIVELLEAIPGLHVVDLDNRGMGYQISSLDGMPDERNRHLASGLRKAEAAGVTTFAGIFHADHRELVAHESEWPFEIVNYMELIGESLGINRPDLFKRLKQMQDVDAILEASRENIAAHKLDPEEVRDVILREIIEAQYLPIDLARHPNTD